MADQLGVMFDGRLVQWANPYMVYHEPCNTDVAKFIGDGALISGTQRHHSVETPLGTLSLAPCCCNESTPERAVNVLLRQTMSFTTMTARCRPRSGQTFRGADFLYTLELANGGRFSRWCPATTTTRSITRSASDWKPITW